VANGIHRLGRRGIGNSRDKRARRLFLCPGRSVACFWCGRRISRRRMEVDRWPICGHLGGSYRRDNIVASCPRCNGTRCHRPIYCALFLLVTVGAPAPRRRVA
jgi:hypothetical protein